MDVCSPRMPKSVLLLVILMVAVCTEAKISAADLPRKCVTVGDLKRCWYTYVPASVTSAPGPVPLVINMHGFTSTGEYHVGYMGWDVLAETEGFVAIWPDGENNAWNAGSCCGTVIDTEKNIDDVAFIKELIRCAVSDGTTVDPTRVYLAGHSNGCAMAQRVAAQASSEIAAVGCHSLYLLSDAASDYVPVPIIEIHGTADKVVGYEKFAWVENGPGALSNFAAWVKLNGCTGNMSVVDHGNYETRTYDTCKGANNQRSPVNASTKNGTEVTLVTVKGGDHNPWSGNELDGGGAAPDTTKIAWNFVKRFRRATATRTSGGGKCENPTSGTESDLPNADSETKVSGAHRPSPSWGGKCGTMVIALAALILQISTLFDVHG